MMRTSFSFVLLFLCFCSSFSRDSHRGRRNNGFYSNTKAPDELMQASYIADVQKVKDLLDLDPDMVTNRPPVLVNRLDPRYNRTSLMVCGLDPQSDDNEETDLECTKIARLLFDAGASLHHKDKHGWDALSMGAVRGFAEYCRFLLQNNVSVDSVDEFNRTPLMKAGAHAHVETVKILMEYGANVSLQDLSGQTFLHHVALLVLKNESYYHFFEEVLRLHTLDQVDHFLDKDKRNILMYASIENNENITQSLLDFGCDPRLQDKYLLTASQMTNNTRIKNLLIEKSVEFVEKVHQLWLDETDLEL
jgi:ankyrin repeat protein